MAQVVKLKRTSVQGRVPTTSNIELGELAINTYDGKLYLKKDSGTPSILQLATQDSFDLFTSSYDSRYVNLSGNSTIGGNLTISGDLTVSGTTTTIDTTSLNIGDNIIELNYGGSSTTGGIYIKDATGSSTVSGSLLWNSINDVWTVGKKGSEVAIVDLSSTQTLTNKSIDGDNNTIENLANASLTNSSITIAGISTPLGNSITLAQITGGTSIVSGSSQLSSTFLSKLGDGVISGSNLDGMTVSGSFSGSFQGDGSDLTGLSVDQVATVTDTFTNVTSKAVTHNFGTKNVIVSVYDNNDSYFLPSSIITTNTNTVTVTFASTESGRIVVAKGGHVVQGVSSDSNLLDGEDGTYYLDYDNFTDVPSGIVSGSSQLANSSISNESLNTFTQSAISGTGTSGSLPVFTDTDTLSNSTISTLSSGTTVTHSNNTNIIFTVSGSNGELLTVTDSNTGNLLEVNDTSGVNMVVVGSTGNTEFNGHLTPSTTEVYDLGSTSKRWRDLFLSGSTIDLGGTLITTDASGDINFKDSSTQALKKVIVDEIQIGSGSSSRKIKVDGNGKIKFSDKDDSETRDDITLPIGVISGSSQITSLTTYTDTVSGASSYIVNHSLNEEYPIVQCWNTSTKQQEVPSTITSSDVNKIVVVFSTTFAGKIIVKK